MKLLTLIRSPLFQANAIKGFGLSEDLRDFAHTDVETRMTSFLGKEDVLKHGSWGREQALTLATEICNAFDAGNDLLSEVAFTARLIKDLLQVSDLGAMSSALERFHKVEQEQILEDGVIQFLQKHKNGMGIIADCQKRIEEGQAQLQGELFVTNLQDALNRVKEAEDAMTGDAVSDVVSCFWNMKASKDEQKLTSKHRLSVQMMMKDFWRAMGTGVRTMLSSTLVTCLEEILGYKKAKDEATTPDPAFDLDDVLRQMACAGLAQHQFWSKPDVAKVLPASLKKDMDAYTSLQTEVAELVRFVFSKKKIMKIDATCFREPTSDCLRSWSHCDTPLATYVFDENIADAFKQQFIRAAAEELQQKAVAAFHSVGTMVQGCIDSVSNLESMASSLAEVKLEVTLGKDGLWSSVLPSLLEAGGQWAMG